MTKARHCAVNDWGADSAAWRPLPRSFYEPAADAVAPRLLGCLLLRRISEGWCGGVIVETEAYLADDPACHAFRGPTPRNRAMFGPPGHAYVYFIYGMHYCFNTVCQPAGTGEAVLIRAIDPLFGEADMRRRRGAVRKRDLTNGPAKLCGALGIGRELDGLDLCDARAPVMVAEHPGREAYLAAHGPVTVSTRIGITKGAEMPLRFCLGGGTPNSKRSTPNS